jgi:hypothetical protein
MTLSARSYRTRLCAGTCLAVLASVGVTGVGAGAPTRGQAPRRTAPAGAVVVPFELFSNTPVIDVHINGKGPFRMFLDTGAQGSAIDASLAKELDLPVKGKAGITSPGGQPMPADLVAIDTVRVGSFERANATAVSFDRLGLHGPGAPRGVFSANAFFEGYLLTLDYSQQQLWIYTGELPAANGQDVFEYSATERLPVVPLQVGGKAFRLHLDSGASGGFTLPLDAAKDLPLDAAPREVGRGRRVDREVVIYGATLKGTVTLGRFTFDNPGLTFNEGIDVGHVGYAVLKDFAITLDKKNRRIRLDR